MFISTATISCACQSSNIKLYPNVTSTCACGRAYRLHVCAGCGAIGKCYLDCARSHETAKETVSTKVENARAEARAEADSRVLMRLSSPKQPSTRPFDVILEQGEFVQGSPFRYTVAIQFADEDGGRMMVKHFRPYSNAVVAFLQLCDRMLTYWAQFDSHEDAKE